MSNITPDSRLYHVYSYARLRGRFREVVFHTLKDDQSLRNEMTLTQGGNKVALDLSLKIC